MIVLDASAAIDLLIRGPNAALIERDLARDGATAMPAHFEADVYAGLRHMVNRRALSRDQLPDALGRLARFRGVRAPLAPLLPAAYQMFDQVPAHDSFYVALALAGGATLLTSDGPQARAATQLGATVLLRPAQEDA